MKGVVLNGRARHLAHPRYPKAVGHYRHAWTPTHLSRRNMSRVCLYMTRPRLQERCLVTAVGLTTYAFPRLCPRAVIRVESTTDAAAPAELGNGSRRPCRLPASSVPPCPFSRVALYPRNRSRYADRQLQPKPSKGRKTQTTMPPVLRDVACSL
ncbi:hypothetical protein OH77DRAFT_218022 [Trametes cingulata]|nr:hypothetical protein OH77DRAFT_218022 [Trametes cingulata]